MLFVSTMSDENLPALASESYSFRRDADAESDRARSLLDDDELDGMLDFFWSAAAERAAPSNPALSAQGKI